MKPSEDYISGFWAGTSFGLALAALLMLFMWGAA